MNKVIKATLRYLFQEYQKNPGISYSINGVISEYDADPVQITDYLLAQNWIRERWIYQDNLVSCRITVAGIEEIDPMFIHNRLHRIIGTLLDSGGSRDLMEIFSSKIEAYAINLDIVFQLEKLGMVGIRRENGSIMILLTDYGRQYFQKKGSSLFSLMAIA